MSSASPVPVARREAYRYACRISGDAPHPVCTTCEGMGGGVAQSHQMPYCLGPDPSTRVWTPGATARVSSTIVVTVEIEPSRVRTAPEDRIPCVHVELVFRQDCWTAMRDTTLLGHHFGTPICTDVHYEIIDADELRDTLVRHCITPDAGVVRRCFLNTLHARLPRERGIMEWALQAEHASTLALAGLAPGTSFVDQLHAAFGAMQSGCRKEGVHDDF